MVDFARVPFYGVTTSLAHYPVITCLVWFEAFIFLHIPQTSPPRLSGAGFYSMPRRIVIKEVDTLQNGVCDADKDNSLFHRECMACINLYLLDLRNNCIALHSVARQPICPDGSVDKSHVHTLRRS